MSTNTLSVRFVDRAALPQLIRMGNQSDHLAQSLRFELPDFPDGAAVFLHLHIGGYADVVQLTGGRIFTPTRSHTAHTGKWTAHLEVLLDGDAIWWRRP